MRVEIEDIPDEILIKIFSYLNPNDLLFISKINRRFKELTYDQDVVRKVDFNQCRQMKINSLTLFLKERAKNIESLDFSKYSFIHDWDRSLVWQCVTSCTNLQSLCLINTEIDIRSVVELLYALLSLKELSWSLFGQHFEDIHSAKETFSKCANRKKLNLKTLQKLDIYFTNGHACYNFLNYFLFFCPNLEYLHVHVLHNYFKKNLPQFNLSCKLKHLSSILMTDFNYSNTLYFDKQFDYENGDYNLELTRSFYSLKDSLVLFNKIWLEHGFMDILALEVKAGLQLDVIANASVVLLSKVTSLRNEFIVSAILERLTNVYHLGLKEIFVSDNDLEHLCRISKSKLNYLYMDAVYMDQINDKLNKLFSCCPFLIELNLQNTHFETKDEVCESLSQLKALQRLVLPSCAVKVVECNVDRSNKCINYKKKQQNKMSPLHPVIEKCHHLFHLEIHGCETSSSYGKCCDTVDTCTDSNLSAISKLSMLRSLTLVNLPFIKHAKFLIDVAKNCKHFKQLRVHHLGKGKFSSSYIETYCTFLKEASSLTDFRIGHKNFDLLNLSFWNSISEAKHLERVCIIGRCKGSINTMQIMEAISELPSITAFHIHSPFSITSKEKKELQTFAKKGNQKGEVIELLLVPIQWADDLIHLSLRDEYCKNAVDMCFLCTDVALPKN